MADAKPKLAEARQAAQPGRLLAETKTVDLMKTDAMIKRFASYAPPGIDFRPLHASAALAIAQSSDLQKAEPLTLVQAMMGVTRLGLEINSPLGHAYLIPFEIDRKIIIQVVIGYRGYIDLSYRSGHLISIGGDIATVPEWEAGHFKFQKGTQPFVHHTFSPSRLEDVDTPAFAYAVADLKDGTKFDVIPWAAIQRIKGGSQGYVYAKGKGENSKTLLKNPWVAHEWQMGVKTVLRRMSKTMQLSAALAQAVALDEMGEERDIDFGSVVDIDPSQWRDLTDTVQREQDGKTGEQHQVKTPDGDKPKAEVKKAEAGKPAAAQKADGDTRPEPPMEGEPVSREAAKPDAAKSTPPADKPATNGVAPAAAVKNAKDYWD